MEKEKYSNADKDKLSKLVEKYKKMWDEEDEAPEYTINLKNILFRIHYLFFFLNKSLVYYYNCVLFLLLL